MALTQQHRRRSRTGLGGTLFLPSLKSTPAKNDEHEISRISLSQVVAPASPADVATLHRDFKPLWVAMRVLGAFPITFTHKGNGGFRQNERQQNGVLRVAVFKKKSCACAYSVFVFMLLGGLSLAVTYRHICLISSYKGTFSLVFSYTCILYCITYGFLPVGHLAEARKIARFINDWSRFQNNSFQLTGSPLSLNIHMQVLVCTFALPVLITMLVIFECVILRNFEEYEAIYYLYIVTAMNYHFVMWYYACLSLSRAASHTTSSLAVELRAHPSDQGVVPKYQELWEDLNYLTCTTGDVLGFAYGFLLVTTFAMLACSTYGTVSESAFNGDKSVQIGLGISSLGVLASLCLLCNSAHLATENLNHFRKDVCAEPSRISLSGFVIINRGLLISLIAAIVTYLVVLLHFSEGTRSGRDSSQAHNETMSSPTPT